jgi:hypothetical protein
MENSIFNSWRMENAGLTSDETVVAEVSGVQRFAPDSPLWIRTSSTRAR